MLIYWLNDQSVVPKEFLSWVQITTSEYAESTGKDWIPGTVHFYSNLPGNSKMPQS